MNVSRYVGKCKDDTNQKTCITCISDEKKRNLRRGKVGIGLIMKKRYASQDDACEITVNSFFF